VRQSAEEHDVKRKHPGPVHPERAAEQMARPSVGEARAYARVLIERRIAEVVAAGERTLARLADLRR